MFDACPCWWTKDVKYAKQCKPPRCFHPAKHLHHPLGGCWEWEPQCHGYCDCQIASFTTFSPGRGAWFASWLVRKLRHSQQLSHRIWTCVYAPLGFKIDVYWSAGCLGASSKVRCGRYGWLHTQPSVCWNFACGRQDSAHEMPTASGQAEWSHFFVFDILVLSTWQKTNPSSKKSDRSAVRIVVSCQMPFAWRKSMDIEL